MGLVQNIVRKRLIKDFDKRKQILNNNGESEELYLNFDSIDFSFKELRNSDFLKDWFVYNLPYFNASSENNLIIREDFKFLKSTIKKALKLTFEQASEMFSELEEDSYKEEFIDVLEMIDEALSFNDEENEFYYSFYY